MLAVAACEASGTAALVQTGVWMLTLAAILQKKKKKIDMFNDKSQTEWMQSFKKKQIDIK